MNLNSYSSNIKIIFNLDFYVKYKIYIKFFNSNIEYKSI